jgi:hypothetical protein
MAVRATARAGLKAPKISPAALSPPRFPSPTTPSQEWDQGWASEKHTPAGRGYARSLVYAEHMNNYWSQVIEPTGTACTSKPNAPIYDLWEDVGPARSLAGKNNYFDDLVFSRALEAVANFSSGSLAPASGLFLDVRPHAMHWPLMLEPDLFANFSWVDNDEDGCKSRFYGDGMWPATMGPGGDAFSCRRQYQAMLYGLDARIGSLEDAIVAAGLWNETLVTVFSDNGGVIDLTESAGNNYPLRGGKYRPFEGGIRMTAFWSGGYLPASSRGTTVDGLISVADYSTTLCELAGGSGCSDDPLAAANEPPLPPVDSINMWPYVTGAVETSPRVEIPVNEKVLLWANGSTLWKLMQGHIDGAGWTGPVFPNSTGANPSAPSLSCNPACLFNLTADPTEHDDVADSHADVVALMVSSLANQTASFYSNSDAGGTDLCPAGTKECLCYAALNTWGGFLGYFHTWP